MEAKELKTFSVDELKGRIRQWKEELFRASFKAQTNETKDTSVIGKLRKDIARAYTVLNAGELGTAKTEAKKPVKAASTKTAKIAAPVAEDKAEAKAEDKPAKKTKTAAKKTKKGDE
jgi:large subunit ribosomal protein L29